MALALDQRSSNTITMMINMRTIKPPPIYMAFLCSRRAYRLEVNTR
jgi:hypothetical protein